MKIIGVELRVAFQDPRQGYQQREVAIIPCEIHLEIPAPFSEFFGTQFLMNGTLHTDRGDINMGQWECPRNYLIPNKTILEASQALRNIR
jgi:hypothetical protein